MADQTLDIQRLINADKDFQTVEDFIKKPKDETVTTRFGDEIMTLKGLEEEVKKSGGYFKRYTSLSAANADIANIPVDAVVKVTSETDGGDYEKASAGATSLTKSAYDPLAQSKAIISSLDSLKINSGKEFPFLKLNRNGVQLDPPSLLKNAILNVKVKGATSPHVYKIDVFANGESTVYNPSGWVIRRFDSRAAFESGAAGTQINSGSTAQQAISGNNIQTLKITTYVDGPEFDITIDPSKLPAIGTPVQMNSATTQGWNHIIDPVCYDYTPTKIQRSQLSIELIDEFDHSGVWWGADGGDFKYDPVTRVLSWSKPLVLQSSRIATNRINIPAGSIAVPNNAFSAVYFDLTAVPSDGNLTAAMLPNCIKVATYTNGALKANINTIVMFVIDPTTQGLARSKINLPVVNVGNGNNSSWDKSKVYFNKSVNSAFFWQAGLKQNYIRTDIVRQLTALDPFSTGDNTDIWRLTLSYEISASTGNSLNTIVQNGEWDTAISYTGSSAHVGGWHGNEVLTKAYFLCDNIYHAQNSVIEGYFKEIKLYQESNIYLKSSSTIMLKRKKIMTITSEGIKNQQWLEWVTPQELVTAFITMFPVSRLNGASVLTSTDIRLPQGEVYDVSASGFTEVKVDVYEGSQSILSGSNSGISATLTVNKMTGIPEPKIYVSSSANYNKMYLNAFNNTGGLRFTPNVGDKWHIDVTYQLSTAN